MADELRRAVGAGRAPRLAERLAEATRSYQRDRLQEARQMLARLADEAPASAAVQELYGLTLYRMDRWDEALRHLRIYHDLTGSYDQHPVMADCERALRRFPAVDELWEELREASPSAEVVAEGRIVAAGARADNGDLPGAVALLESAARKVNHPREHHLRLWYALADLYEKAGDMPAAKEMFRKVLRYDATFHDAAERIAALS
ncbi:MAG TPA: tetratricopeptide repeat protein [Acidimicrobiales bacterium]|nr:tetratricopeptide repeat protein [Acidimicrobiales bacterium]